MALKDQIPLGMCLPHRSPDPIEVPVIHHLAQRAEALGFRDLWVTEHTLDHASCLDALTLLTYAAALTSSIRLGVSVLVLPVHSPIQVARRAKRFLEFVELIKALWAEDSVTYQGDIFALKNGVMNLNPSTG